MICAKHKSAKAPCCPVCLIEERDQLRKELAKANKQIEGYAELLGSANTDVENLQKWSKGLQVEFAKRIERVI